MNTRQQHWADTAEHADGPARGREVGGSSMKLSDTQRRFLFVLDRYVDEDSPEMDLARPSERRTARSLEKLGLVTVRDGIDEAGQNCVWVKRT